MNGHAYIIIALFKFFSVSMPAFCVVSSIRGKQCIHSNHLSAPVENIASIVGSMEKVNTGQLDAPPFLTKPGIVLSQSPLYFHVHVQSLHVYVSTCVMNV